MPDDYPGEGASDDEIDVARTSALNEILNADEPLKVAVAGPGTGKTHTFKCIVEQTDGRVLILTFLTSLVDDLKAKLGDLADIYSFHGFAKHELHRYGSDGIDQEFDYFPPVELIFVSDMQITDQIGSRDEIADALMNLRADGRILPLLLRSGNYYNAVSHGDAVYRLLTTFQAQPELVPEFAHILVDEYQDFGLMEVELIRALAVQSPILIVGDDDQALYRFRHASPAHIRALVAGAEYTNFALPYCSRCTAVLVEATHLLVQRAQGSGLLADRIAKPYLCYLPGKRTDSEAHPRIIHARCSVDNNRSPYMARYIAEQIRQIPQSEAAESREEGYPTVLIVGQRQFTNRVEALLSEQGFSVTRKGGAKLALGLSDGYRRLVMSGESRLGWRILLELHQPPCWEEWVAAAMLVGAELSELIDDEYRSRQLEIVDVVGKVMNSETLTDEEQTLVETATGLSLEELRAELGVAADEEPVELEVVSEADAGPTIMITTLLGSKGLQAQHVFVVGVSEGSFPRDNAAISEGEVCEMLVALTRARKSCTLVSCGNHAGQWMGESRFVQWLRPLLEERTVDRHSHGSG